MFLLFDLRLHCQPDFSPAMLEKVDFLIATVLPEAVLALILSLTDWKIGVSPWKFV
jgi:hypothetical protein